MRQIIRNGRVYCRKEWKRADVVIEDGLIAEVRSAEEGGPAGGKAEEAGLASGTAVAAGGTGGLPCEYDASGKYVVPGFIDVHTHGAVGVDVNQADRAGYEKISRFFAGQGTTSFLCSILTDTEERTKQCIREAVSFMKDRGSGAKLLGIHLEGPFLAPEYKGAMPELLLRKADAVLLAAYQREAGGAVRYLTVSPEVEGAAGLIAQAAGLGIRTAIGHSGADYETAWAAVRAGAVSATHTFNAMKLMHQHFPAVSGAVLESEIYCEAICDGRHLHPGVVRLLLKTKGMDRVIAVTDSIMAAGMPDGEYTLGVNEVVVKDGDAKLRDGTRAGSTLTTRDALKNLGRFTGRPLEELIGLLTENPARMLGLSDRVGSIEAGKCADLVILDEDWSVRDTFIDGKRAGAED